MTAFYNSPSRVPFKRHDLRICVHRHAVAPVDPSGIRTNATGVCRRLRIAVKPSAILPITVIGDPRRKLFSARQSSSGSAWPPPSCASSSARRAATRGPEGLKPLGVHHFTASGFRDHSCPVCSRVPKGLATASRTLRTPGSVLCHLGQVLFLGRLAATRLYSRLLFAVGRAISIRPQDGVPVAASLLASPIRFPPIRVLRKVMRWPKHSSRVPFQRGPSFRRNKGRRWGSARHQKPANSF